LSNSNPGTVSKILWHFTGGPLWDPKKQKQQSRLKSPVDAFKNLKAIIKSQRLKVGSYKEVINVVLPTYREYSRSKRRIIEKKNKKITMNSSPICCLADIPVVHLGYHAKRYGQFAIGFHRSSVLKHGFNPVLYTLPTTEVIRHIYEGLSSIGSIDSSSLVAAAENIDFETGGDFDEDSDSLDVSIETSEVVSEAEVMEGYAQEAQQSIKDFIAFIKTFEPTQFHTIYCEREWRSVDDFNFQLDDVAMIVVPKDLNKKKYFEPLLRASKSLKIARKIPIVPWEDLVEH